MNLLIKNANIITMNGAETILDGFIGVAESKICYVGKNPPETPDNTQIFDAQGAIVMPGLINAHTHLPMVLMRGLADDLNLQDWLFNHIFPREAELTEDDIYQASKLALKEMIKGGTTTFCDMYFMTHKIAQATAESGLRANLGSGLSCMDIRDDYSDEPCVKAFLELKNQDFGNKIRFDVAPHAIYTSSLEILKYVATLGDDIHIHISETQLENQECLAKHSKTPTQFLVDLRYFEGKRVNAAHCVWLNDEDIETFANNNASVVHCPSSNLKLGSGIAPIAKYMERGVNVALGTDGAASNNALNMLREINLSALIHKGVQQDPTLINAITALEMATVNGAKALGREDEIGQIKIGYEADLIFIDTSSPNMQPLNSIISAVVYSAQAGDVRDAMVGGEFLMKSWEII